MDIGEKIKRARLNAKFTQEQVAETLGVSRQTISNWETEKTYPDIISVVKMSELYVISLDHLLKEEKPMSSNYLQYLEESTNTVKSKNKLSKLILIVSYLVIWAVSVVVFWNLTNAWDAMGYTILYLYFVLPITTLVISFIIGLQNHWGRWKWLGTIIFGIMYMLAEYATFSIANMVSSNKFLWPHPGMILAGAIVSLVAMGLGYGIYMLKQKKQKKTA